MDAPLKLLGPPAKDYVGPVANAFLPWLEIHVKAAQGLSIASGTPDPYVVCGPARGDDFDTNYETKKEYKMKSEVAKKTINPVWRNLKFHWIAADSDSPLRFVIYNHVTVGSDKVICEGKFNYDKHDLVPGPPKTVYIDLQVIDKKNWPPAKPVPCGKLELLVKLFFNTDAIGGQKLRFFGLRSVQRYERGRRDEEEPINEEAKQFLGATSWSFDGELMVQDGMPTVRIKNFAGTAVVGPPPAWLTMCSCTDLTAVWHNRDKPSAQGHIFRLNAEGKREKVMKVVFSFGGDFNAEGTGEFSPELRNDEAEIVVEFKHADDGVRHLIATWSWQALTPTQAALPQNIIVRCEGHDHEDYEMPYNVSTKVMDIRAFLEGKIGPQTKEVRFWVSLDLVADEKTVAELGLLPGEAITYSIGASRWD